MNEQIISYEIAIIASEKGFDINCCMYYAKGNSEYAIFHDINLLQSDIIVEEYYFAPTQSLLQKWLREVHKIDVIITFEPIDDSTVAYVWNVLYLKENGGKKAYDWHHIICSFSEEIMCWYDTYEEALEEGLQVALKLINKKK